MNNKNARYKRILSIVLLLPLVVGMLTPEAYAAVNGDGTDVINENYADRLSLQPLAPAFRVETLLRWSPNTDPDALLNRSTIPLNKQRFKGSQINPLAHPQAGITSAAITTWNHDEASSVGSNAFNVYAFDNWQLLDSYIYWAGTNEGIFAIPSPDIVDAAHRNGVPVYATVGFPWGSGTPGALAEVNAFTQQNPDGSFPIADKMIEIAEYYGFDGYFMNQETYGVSKATAERMNEMMRYVKRHSNLRFSWYDAQSNNGNVSYQNAVNSNNDMYVKPAADGTYAVDEFFLNYNWGTSQINTTVTTMKGHNRDPYDAYAGFEIQQNSYNTNINTTPLLNEQKQPKVSIALYTPNSTMGLAANPADFHEKEKYLWTGPQGDPSLADDSSSWKGMARFVTDASVIQALPFTTNFNSGHGKQYFIDGAVTGTQEWNNRSVQDIMPTWRWWIRSVGSRINVAYDFDQAYNGGNSLKFSGPLDAASVNDVMLYSTKLQISDKTKVRLVYHNPTGADLSLGVAYGADYAKEQMKYYALPKHGVGWQSTVIDLGGEAGKTAYALSLQVRNEAPLDQSSIHLGQLEIYDSVAPVLPAPQQAKVDEQLIRTAYEAEARLSWTKASNVLHYEIYQKNADGSARLIGVTPNNHFYTSNISRTAANASSDNITKLLVVAVNQDYKRGTAAEVDFVWGMDISATEFSDHEASPNVALHAKVTGVSAENEAEPAAKALDGTVTGNSKWCATNKQSGYMSIDLGETKTIRRWRVEHAEYGGEAKDMNTIDFELLYKDDAGNWISAKRIRDNHSAVTDIILDQPVTAREFKLQVYNSGSSPWGAIRIYEWQMFERGALPKTDNIMMHFVTAENQEGAQDKVVLERVRNGQKVRLYKSLESTEALTEKVASKDGTLTIEGLDFGPAAGRIYYTVQSEGSDESLKYSTVYAKEPGFNPSETMLLSESSVYASKEFTVQFGLRNVTESVYAADIAMTYDSKLFQFISADPTKDGINLVSTVKDTPGKLRFILASNGTDNGMKGEVQILKLKFKAAKVEAATAASISVTDTTMGDDAGKETKASPSSITVQIKPEIVHPGMPGDVNQDGKVSIGDLAMIAANYGKTSASADWELIKHLDVNKDLKIDIEDLVFVASKIIE
ncbi:endo-beta-N-acetylglucosaminidase [Paenibacillus guangzhouensis]|uniref:endo-beta-N-acetylglucosaminidase n=1 Tax=Paenibacillus guangzhouensis TaxID=1473112 RepID=UPI001266A291|nr:cohesin domain-containing protein [Paenibacillus guangzhouensis]